MAVIWLLEKRAAGWPPFKHIVPQPVRMFPSAIMWSAATLFQVPVMIFPLTAQVRSTIRPLRTTVSACFVSGRSGALEVLAAPAVWAFTGLLKKDIAKTVKAKANRIYTNLLQLLNLMGYFLEGLLVEAAIGPISISQQG